MLSQGVFWNAGTGTVDGQGFVTNAIESGGTCTLTLSHVGTPDVTGTSVAFADATVTYCPKIQIPKSSLASGIWTATLSYDSANYRGESPPETVQVPA